MENQNQERQEVQHGSRPSSPRSGSLGTGAEHGNQVANQETLNPNRGMSKKERRRVDALKQRLEPRIEKLEEQMQQQIAKITNGSDKLRAQKDALALELLPGSTGYATSMEEGDIGGENQKDQANKTTEMKGEATKETPIIKLVNALQAAGLGDDPLRRESTDALENPSSPHGGSLGAGSKEEARSPQVSQQPEQKGEGENKDKIEKILDALQKAGLGSDPLRRENADALENEKTKARSPLASSSNETSKDSQSENKEDQKAAEMTNSPISKLVNALQAAGLGGDPTALRLVADLAALDPLRRETTDASENGKQEAHSPLASKARASHVIQPSGGGVPPAPDLRIEYEKRVNELRPGDIDGLMEVKREFRRKGLEVY